MTQPDETTMPDRPEKAHGDALEEVVDTEAGEEPGHAESEQQG